MYDVSRYIYILFRAQHSDHVRPLPQRMRVDVELRMRISWGLNANLSLLLIAKERKCYEHLEFTQNFLRMLFARRNPADGDEPRSSSFRSANLQFIFTTKSYSKRAGVSGRNCCRDADLWGPIKDRNDPRSGLERPNHAANLSVSVLGCIDASDS